MGGNQSTTQNKTPGRNMRIASCFDDVNCKNIDAARSTPNNIVYVCPYAKCSSTSGTCDCGPGCELDPYTGMCCSHVERDPKTGNTFCVEDVYKLPNGQTKKCSVPDQTRDGIVIPGEVICGWYDKYNGAK